LRRHRPISIYEAFDPMTIRTAIMKILRHDEVNFRLTNSLPRRRATQFFGWFSKIENPMACRASLAVWRWFSDLDLSEAEQTQFRSMHDCFTRALKPGARPIAVDPTILVSPCDGVIGASGRVQGGQVLQVKGLPYELSELLADPDHAETFRNGCYVTLRLTSSMYHRFHAPHDCHIESVTHIFGDAWNVNPPTLRRVDRVFCRNERAVIRMTLSATGHRLTLVPVAAILVAGIRLRFLDMQPLRGKPAPIACDVSVQKGAEMGWFEHGSTILVFAPAGFALYEGLGAGNTIRMGQPLMRLPT
jgi:phosphatidylserine decarboxylase